MMKRGGFVGSYILIALGLILVFIGLGPVIVTPMEMVEVGPIKFETTVFSATFIGTGLALIFMGIVWHTRLARGRTR